MIKLIDIIKTTPGLEYHLKHKLPISENIYRYSSEAFVNLFGEARELWNTGMLELPLPDVDLLENTDIGKWGMYEGVKVPLDLPMVVESSLEDEIANDEFGMDYDQLGPGEQEWVRDEIDNMRYESRVDEAEYQGKKVELNKPKRGGTGGKKYYVYVKDPKTKNVKKVSFGAAGGGQNLSVKLDDPKRRKAFADRHNCKEKTDKTQPGYWACRISRYWKSLGGNKNYSGFW